MIHIIVAMNKKRVIGNKGNIPWELPQDLKLFRQLTIGQTVLMGRTTYQSIGQPLAQRQNIVISRSLPETEGIEICSSFAEGIKLANTFSGDIYCIGGRDIYKQALEIAEKLHISWVDSDACGDCFFPGFNLNDWAKTAEQEYPGFIHRTYIRKNKNAP